MERKIIYLDDAIDALRYAQHRFTVADEAGGMGTVKWSEDVIYFAAAERVLAELPSAQPEIKPLDYQDCANAMLRMWMDEVITDGEYNRVMDKLNAFWRTRNERSNQQTGGD